MLIKRLRIAVAGVLLLAVSLYAAAVLTFLQVTPLTTDTATYTFSGINLGTESADRCVVVAFHSRVAGTAALSISSVTIGGVSASIAVQRVENTTNSDIAALAYAVVPTGTTGDVVVALNQTMLRAAIGSWYATGANCVASDTDSSVATDPTVNLDVPAGGFAIGACTWAQISTATWSGITEAYDAVVESSVHHTGASDLFASAQTGLAMTCNSGATANPVGVFASFGPATTSTRAVIIGGGVF